MQKIHPEAAPAFVSDDLRMILLQNLGGTHKEGERIAQFMGYGRQGGLDIRLRMLQEPGQFFVFCPKPFDFREQSLCTFLCIIHFLPRLSALHPVDTLSHSRVALKEEEGK